MDPLPHDGTDDNMFEPRSIGMIKAGRLQYTRAEYERILSMLSDDGSERTDTLREMIVEAIDVIDDELRRRASGSST